MNEQSPAYGTEVGKMYVAGAFAPGLCNATPMASGVSEGQGDSQHIPRDVTHVTVNAETEPCVLGPGSQAPLVTLGTGRARKELPLVFSGGVALSTP